MTTPEFEKYAGRPFSFYPPILNIEHNEWLWRKDTWSETLVRNTKTGVELWIPRRFLGEISRIDEPVMIVGLTQELEYKGGAVWPYKTRAAPSGLTSAASSRCRPPRRARAPAKPRRRPPRAPSRPPSAESAG